MNSILIICGPTATGKSALALKLAEKFQGDLIAADSRQVYTGMDIGTGKDIPNNFKFQISNFKFSNKSIGFYTNTTTKIWGLNLVDPDEEFSVTDFVRYTKPIIEHIWAEKKVPIITGGTGLYIKALVEPLANIYIPRDSALRVELEGVTTAELQAKLKAISPARFALMNHSDQNNPRRLVRAIEQEKWKALNESKTPSLLQRGDLGELSSESILKIGLRAPLNVLFQRIDQRVEERVKQGIIDEVQTLLAKGYTWDLPALSGLGYKQWQAYLVGKASLADTLSDWKKAEHEYAKRQLTWFKKDSAIEWFDITQPNIEQSIIAKVEKWYTKYTNADQD